MSSCASGTYGPGGTTDLFIERPFQNWTRRTADLLATVLVTRITAHHGPIFDGVFCMKFSALRLVGCKVWNLQVSNASDRPWVARTHERY